MSKHEFGIMSKAPVPGERYDRYEPEKYDCIAVEEELVDEIISETGELTMYWHTVDSEAKGLTESGITLIPPSAMRCFLAVINEKKEYDGLRQLFEKAYTYQKWVIHFGL